MGKQLDNSHFFIYTPTVHTVNSRVSQTSFALRTRVAVVKIVFIIRSTALEILIFVIDFSSLMLKIHISGTPFIQSFNANKAVSFSKNKCFLQKTLHIRPTMKSQKSPRDKPSQFQLFQSQPDSWSDSNT
jgi:DNA helicase IV